VIDAALLEIVGFTSLALLVVLWLVVSFLSPGKARSRLSWVAATCMYLALLCLFTYHFQDAYREGSVVLMIALGFLGVVFLCGVVVSSVKTVREFAGRGSASPR